MTMPGPIQPVNIFSTINDWIASWTKTFEQGTPPPTTKLLSEFFVFLEGFPFSQVAGAALAEGTNIPLDVTAAAALAADITKAFFAGQSVQTATTLVAASVGITPAVMAQIVYDPVHPADPTQFSRGR